MIFRRLHRWFLAAAIGLALTALVGCDPEPGRAEPPPPDLPAITVQEADTTATVMATWHNRGGFDWLWEAETAAGVIAADSVDAAGASFIVARPAVGADTLLATFCARAIRLNDSAVSAATCAAFAVAPQTAPEPEPEPVDPPSGLDIQVTEVHRTADSVALAVAWGGGSAHVEVYRVAIPGAERLVAFVADDSPALFTVQLTVPGLSCCPVIDGRVATYMDLRPPAWAGAYPAAGPMGQRLTVRVWPAAGGVIHTASYAPAL